MDPITLAVLGLGIMFLLIFLHVPIGISMIIVGTGGFALLSGVTPAGSMLAFESWNVISNPSLVVIPLFLLMGNFATASGLSSDIYKLAHAFLGHRRGGLALSTIAGCGLFGAVCGSSAATAATFGTVALPEMLSRKYEPGFAAGCIAAGGNLGSMVPPSVILVIYAVMAEGYIIELFIAAVIPAAISIACYLMVVAVYVRLKPDAGPAGPRMGRHERFTVLIRAWGVVLVLIVILVGIYGGIFTVTEAAAVGTILCFCFALFRRMLTLDSFWKALTGTASTIGMVYTIMIGGNVFAYFITLTHMPDATIAAISHMNLPTPLILIVLLLIYLILGSIFDTVAAMLITLPFVLPLITSMGYSLVWWGLVNVIVVEIGMITPPIGLNVFVLHGVAPGIPLNVIFRGIFPFLLGDFARLLIVVMFPFLSLWLPGVLM